MVGFKREWEECNLTVNGVHGPSSKVLPVVVQEWNSILALFIRTNCLPKYLYLFVFLPTMNESSYCYTSSLAFGVIIVLDFGYFDKYAETYHYCCHLCSPYDIWCGTFFICVFAISMFCLEKYLLRSLANFLKMRSFVFLFSF